MPRTQRSADVSLSPTSFGEQIAPRDQRRPGPATTAGPTGSERFAPMNFDRAGLPSSSCIFRVERPARQGMPLGKRRTVHAPESFPTTRRGVMQVLKHRRCASFRSQVLRSAHPDLEPTGPMPIRASAGPLERDGPAGRHFARISGNGNPSETSLSHGADRNGRIRPQPIDVTIWQAARRGPATQEASLWPVRRHPFGGW